MSGGGGAPAVQAQYSYSSPFQNPAYNAVAMGTKQSPGPIARSIQIGNQLAQNWQDSYTGANPGAYYGITKEQATPQFLANQRLQQGAWSPPNSQTAAGVNAFDPNRNRTIAEANPNLPTQTAAQGGLMSLGNFEGGRSSGSEAVNPQGYARGGAAKPKYNARSSADDKLSALQTAIDGGYKPKPAEVTFMQGMADSAATRQKLGSNVPFSVDPKTGQIKPVARGANQSSADYASYLTSLDTAGVGLDPKSVKQYGVQTGAATQQQNRTSGVNAPYSMQQAVEQRTAYFDPTTGESTNPLFRQAVSRIQEAQQLPSQFGQATDAYNKAISGLQGMTNYTPEQVQAQQIEAAKIARGDIRDAVAQQAQVERMQGGPNVEAVQAEANQMVQPQDVQAVRTRAAQMQGPQSWNAPGTVQQYMDPYQQAVIDQSKFEANRQAAQQRNQMRSQAAGSKAFGGSRAALQEAEANRNLGYMLEDIQNKGMSQAYQQGLQQFNVAQGQGLQAGQANLGAQMQARLANQQAGMTAQQLNQAAGLTTGQANLSAAQQTALANQQAGMTAQQLNQLYGQGGFQSQAANQAAQNQAYNNYVQQQLQAQLQNQGMDYNTAQQNAAMLMQSRTANQNAALQAAMANQQAGLTANQQNIGAYGQILSGAQGLGALGGLQSQTNLANIGALGQAAQAQQNLGQQYLNNVQQSAQNYFNWPQQQLSYPINAINQLPSSGGATTQTQRPASALGWKKGGLMNLRKARRA